jgi:excisionase family DNA binding protein
VQEEIMKTVRPTELLTVQDVAKLLKVPVSWVYGHTRKRAADPLPGYRIGKYWRFLTEEVLAWVSRHGQHTA